MDTTFTISTPSFDPTATEGDYPAPPPAPKKRREDSPDYLLNGVVIPNLRVLLSDVISAVDASIPNKDQNRAVKHIVRSRFDATYMDLLRGFNPGSSFAYGPGYALTPEPDKAKAFGEAYSLISMFE